MSEMPELPLPQDNNQSTDDPAVSLIRSKLAEIYDQEPSAKDEVGEIEEIGPSSRHQKFISDLQASGKNMAEIQTAWHEYYVNLTDSEKHEVWREFYRNSQSAARHPHAKTAEHYVKKPEPEVHQVRTSAKDEIVHRARHIRSKLPGKPESVADVKQRLAARVSADGRLTAKHHLKSLLFGVGSSAVVGLLIVFVMFNQIFLAPFITPSSSASATPLIVDPNSQNSVGPEPRIIIPKINVDAPIVLDAADLKEETIQASLEKGVVLYPFYGKPGEKANPIIFGHSSNNIFNKGSYKFIFVMLKKLENGDTFMINYESKQYVYKVFNKKIVRPDEVSVLSEHPVPSMITLITCDPPGTSTNRLIIQAEQISPDPNANAETTAETPEEAEVIPSNPESLFRRMVDWLIPG